MHRATRGELNLTRACGRSVRFYLVPPCFNPPFTFPSRAPFEHGREARHALIVGWCWQAEVERATMQGLPGQARGRSCLTERLLSSGLAKGLSRDLHGWPSLSTLLSAPGADDDRPGQSTVTLPATPLSPGPAAPSLRSPAEPWLPCNWTIQK